MAESDDQEALDRVAGAVSDGTPVNWDQERHDRPALASELESLRMLSRFRDTYTDLETETVPSDGSLPTDSGTALFHWGSLAIIERLGGGSFGEVFRAFDPVLETYIALKLRKVRGDDAPESVDQFIREARLLARVRHPNVLTVHGADVRDGRVGIWTELIVGRTLEGHLQDHGLLGPREVVAIGADLCRALAAVHAAGLIHRDVKTPNVMRQRGGRIVLMDFGSGGDLPPPGSSQESGGLQGTLLFMPPEQLSGRIAGPATDIYSLGVVLYRLLTNEFPIVASSMAELLEGHLSGPVPLRDRRPDLPPNLVRVIHKALAAKPEERYSTCGAMELALAHSLDDEGTGGASGRGNDGVGDKKGKRVQAGRWVLAGVAVILAAVILVMLPPARRPPEPPAAPPITATATLLRETAAGDEPLLPGSRVGKGDRIALAIQGSTPMHVYVLDQDEVGNVFVLFPLPGVTPGNPLPAGVRHRLPGGTSDSTYSWSVTIEGKRETVIALASKDPLRDLEREIAAFPKAKRGQSIPLERDAVLRLRGIGGVEAKSNPPPTGGLDLAAALKRSLQGSRDVWIWETTLENPTTAQR